MDNIRTEITAATSVAELCSLLNKFERLITDMANDGIDADEIEIPQIIDYHRDDWHEFSDEPVSADATDVLFRDKTGRYYCMSRADIEENDKPGTEY